MKFLFAITFLCLVIIAVIPFIMELVRVNCPTCLTEPALNNTSQIHLNSTVNFDPIQKCLNQTGSIWNTSEAVKSGPYCAHLAFLQPSAMHFYYYVMLPILIIYLCLVLICVGLMRNTPAAPPGGLYGSREVSRLPTTATTVLYPTMKKQQHFGKTQ